ncbi:MAG: hypothetical protein P4M04_15660 [Acidobacteriota bacterium]|nr:hypothetical protein [Acidobacteriota bacterium]
MRFLAGILFLLTAAAFLTAQEPAAPAHVPVSQISPAQTNSQQAGSSDSGQPSPATPSPSVTPVQENASPAGTSVVSPEGPKEQAEAKRQFNAGVKLKSSGRPELALEKFERASKLNPHNVEYLTAREFTRQQLVMEALERGNKALLKNNEIVAMAEFRRALEYDPTNDFALQQLSATLPQPERLSKAVRIVENSTPVELQPSAAHVDFHFRGDARALLTQVAQAYGITAQFEESVQQRRVHFDIEDVNFATAMQAASSVTKTFWIPLSAKQVFFAADTVENRRTFERMALRTFYLPDVTDQQLTEISNSLRVLLNIRFIAVEKSQFTITVRAERSLVDAAGRIIDSLSGGRPEVLLDLNVYQISSSLLRQIGTTWPQQFTMFNISPALLAGLGAGAQNQINQLIASGGINQANSQAISALLAQLSNQSNSLLQQPFASFGGGMTLFGLTTGGVGTTVKLNLNESDVKNLEHVTLRASQDNAAVMKIGERYPIVNASFAPIYNTPAIAKAIGNQSYIAPFPSFNFEDLGVNLKATPVIHADKDVSLKLELQVRSLGTQTVNGIPIINNREYTGSITLKDGEAGVVAGLISTADANSINGYPFLARVPAVTYAASEHDKNVQEDELLIVITPHISSMVEDNSFALQLPSGN